MTNIARSEDMLKKSRSGYRVRGFRTKAGSLLALPFFEFKRVTISRPL